MTAMTLDPATAASAFVGIATLGIGALLAAAVAAIAGLRRRREDAGGFGGL